METGFGGYDLPGSQFDFMFTLVPIFIVVIAVILFGSMIAAAVSGVKQWNTNSHSPVEQCAVRVVAKRTDVSHHHHDNHCSSTSWYYITFEFPDGGRREFQVDDRQYGMIAERDEGMLRFQGTRFLEFSRH